MTITNNKRYKEAKWRETTAEEQKFLLKTNREIYSCMHRSVIHSLSCPHTHTHAHSRKHTHAHQLNLKCQWMLQTNEATYYQTNVQPASQTKALLLPTSNNKRNLLSSPAYVLITWNKKIDPIYFLRVCSSLATNDSTVTLFQRTKCLPL